MDRVTEHRQRSPGRLEISAYTYNPSTREAEEEGVIRVQGQPGLHSEFRASLNYTVRPRLKKKGCRERSETTNLGLGVLGLWTWES